MRGKQGRRRLFDFVKCAGQRLFGDFGVVAEGEQRLALALEFLDQVHLEVGPAGDFKNLEQRDEGCMMLGRSIFLREIRGFLEQVLETQECADALVERIFVGDHAEVGPRRRKILFILSYLQANLNSQL